MLPDAFFQALSRTFAELGVADPLAIHRTLLLRNGSFVGHRYRCGEFSAIWKPGQTAVEFYGPGDVPLRSVPLVVRQGQAAA